jgi:3-oxoacyl-[acyl-carrier-protein] synthase-1
VRRWGSDRVAVILGTSTGGIGASERAYAFHARHGALPAGFTAERSHALDAVVPVVQALADLRGPGYVLSTACSSSARVFAAAQRLLLLGVCDAALVGGVDSLCQLTIRGFASLEVLAPGPCRPFSRERAGINIGEGAALCLLERTGEGPAVLLGVGESSDAHHMTSPHPEGLGARLAMARALGTGGARAVGGRPRERARDRHAAERQRGGGGDRGAVRAGDAGRGDQGLHGAPARRGGGDRGAVRGRGDRRRAGARERGGRSDRRDDPGAVTTCRTPMRTRVVLSNSFAFGGSNVSVLVGGAA